MKKMKEQIITIPAVNYDAKWYWLQATDAEQELIDQEEENRLQMIIDIVTKPDFRALECDCSYGKMILSHSTRKGIDFQLSHLARDGEFNGHDNLMISDFRRCDYSCNGLRDISNLTHNHDLQLTVLTA